MFSVAFFFKRQLDVSISRLVTLAACCLFCCLAASSNSFAQPPDTRAIDQARLAFPTTAAVDDVIRIDTDVVAVELRVTDRNGRPVRNLKSEDFKLYEDSSERHISFFNIERKDGEQQPVAVVFALDISGSMSDEEMRRLRLAMTFSLPGSRSVLRCSQS